MGTFVWGGGGGGPVICPEDNKSTVVYDVQSE